MRCPVPFSHDYGWGQLLSCLCLCQTLILPEREGVQAMCDAISRHRPSIIAGTPAVYAGMVYGISDIARIDRTSVEKATSTGSHLSP
ncbi:AMP-binding protein, partial [Staphylococcus pseudintermedius]|uniref:AMP-binding protein n=1 Tax=Staphylococcus pseudintermedius TaxID=283734 RepID=UPI0034D292F4